MHGGGSVHVWGAICRNAKSRLVILQSFVTEQSYTKVLDDHLIPWATQHRQSDRDWKLQADNAAPHRANIVTDFKSSSGARSIPWPSRSPDLNPIEHTWDVLGRGFKKSMSPQETDAAGGIVAGEVECYVFGNDQPLDRHMPRRINAVISAEGGHTRY